MRKSGKLTQKELLSMHIKDSVKKTKKLTAQQIADIKEMYEMNCTLQTIADEVGCSVTAVWYRVQTPENLTKWRERHRTTHRTWQQKNVKYRDKVARYQKLYDEGKLE